MKKQLAYVFLSAAMASGLAIGTASGASAAHCVAPTGDSPGFSYFGNDHVQEDNHTAVQNGNAEGSKDGFHAGTSGASNCVETSGNPSARAPGR